MHHQTSCRGRKGVQVLLWFFHSLRKSSSEAERRGCLEALGAVMGLASWAIRCASWKGLICLTSSSSFTSLLLLLTSAFLNYLTCCGGSCESRCGSGGRWFRLADRQFLCASNLRSLMKNCFFMSAYLIFEL